MVHYSGNSLVCTSWPLCYGADQGINLSLNLGHRVLGLIVGLLTMTLIFFLRTDKAFESKDELSRGLLSLGFLALFLVGLQGLMGGVASLYRLPTIVNTSHFALSLFFVATIIFIDHRLALITQSKASGISGSKWSLGTSDSITVSIVFLFAMILLGAFVRHSGAMSACGSGLDSILLCSADTGRTVWPPSGSGQVHMFYRFFSLGTWLICAFTLVSVFKANSTKVIRNFLILAALFVSAHQILALASIAFSFTKVLTVLHFASGIAALGFFWKLKLLTTELENQDWGIDAHSPLRDIFSLTKPRLGSLVMATVFVGMMLAPRPIMFFKALGAFTFTFLLVMGAAAYNCWMEKDVDSLMDRTKDRPLPAGRMLPITAFIFSSTLILFALYGLAVYVNMVTAILGFTAAFLYLYAYTPLKQKNAVALYVGAIPGAIPPVMGWTIVTGRMDQMAWALFAILFIWQLPHFLAISIYHAKDYGKAKIKVYPNTSGLRLTQWGILLLTILLAVSSLVPWYFDLGVTDYYGHFAIILNIIFTAVAMRVWIIKKEKEDLLRRWARIYFIGSIIYLPLLLGGMIYLN